MNDKDFPSFHCSSLTYNQHLMILLAYSMRHSLNMEQLRDMLKVLKTHCPTGNYCLENIDDINDIITKQLDICIYDLCGNCGTLFPEDEYEYKCKIVINAGVKWKG